MTCLGVLLDDLCNHHLQDEQLGQDETLRAYAMGLIFSCAERGYDRRHTRISDHRKAGRRWVACRAQRPARAQDGPRAGHEA